jgi:phage terminase large subunit-like protein
MPLETFSALISNQTLKILKSVVAVDPAVSTNIKSDETGIIAACLCSDNKVYILEDLSGKHGPNKWAEEAVRLYKKYNASHIVLESNQGGNMLETTIKNFDRYVRVKLEHRSVGKTVVFEPVVAAYENGDVKHVGDMTLLEEQMMSYNPMMPHAKSPDRADAMSYCVYYLLLGQAAPVTRSVRNLGSW